MSIRAMQSVWQHSKQSGGALVLLLAIADNAHDDGDGAYPSLDTLAQKARMTPRNVLILLKKLEADGEIRVEHGAGPRGTNLYRLLLPDLATPEKISPRKDFTPEKISMEIPGHGISPKPLGTKKLTTQRLKREVGGTGAARTTLETYQPSPDFREWAIDQFPWLDLDPVIENWRDYHRAKGDTIKNFDASLRTWLRREKPPPPGRRPPTTLTTRDGKEVQVGQRTLDNLRAIQAARGERHGTGGV